MTRMTVKDEWVRAAMTDDNVVVELLVRLKQAQAAPPAPKSAVVALKWGIRQPRSKSMLMRCDAKRDGDFNVSTRRSPTTPLSWSGGGGAASPSAADGFEETSKQVLRSPLAAPSRSKLSGANLSLYHTLAGIDGNVPIYYFALPNRTPLLDYIHQTGQFRQEREKSSQQEPFYLLTGVAAHETTSTTTKRSRRKKTFAELKEEESLLVKESIYLKKEIASMRATCKEQRARNENLKRIKRDLNLSTAKNEPEEVPSCQPHPRVPSSLDYVMSTSPSHAIDDCKAMLDSCNIGKALLPDLNMMPVEDESGAETLHGSS
ncbi:hypothetical protein GOBAR_AA27669 [Gossypium barbadense]|uniref:BZIP domain-containing protein n=1 Tax=Gossypium barbadense TaxID=3634 RepID=A0A2P5WPI3_GOSBA|nr:hypothetical protein GOBAR_AA27669 [Gossypium barbadense]